MKIKYSLITLSLITSTLLAQEEIVTLETVTVTASREDESLVKQSLKIEKKESSEIKLDQVIYQKDLLNSISGVHVSQTTSGIGHMLSIRTPISTKPYFLFLQDGIPVQSSGFFNHNGLSYTNFETADSTEVLKGAGTVLYGSDAVAGVINIQSEKINELNETTVNTTLGSHGFFNSKIKKSNRVDDKNSYSLSFSHTTNEGFKEHNKYIRDEINGRYDYILNDENILETSFSFNTSDAQQSGSIIGYDELLNNPNDIGDISDKLGLVDLKRKFDFARISTKWDNYSFDDLEISNIFYLRTNRNRYVATWEKNLPTSDSKNKSFGYMNKITQEFSWGKNNYGLDFEFTKGKTKYIQEFDFIPSGWGSAVDEGTIYDYHVDYLAVSPYIQNSWNINKKIRINSGLRYDFNSFDYKNNTLDGLYGTSNYYRPSDRKDTFRHLSPKFSISYAFDDKTSTYFRYANGFRIPSATRLYSQQKTTGAFEYTLDSETTNTYEIGFKKSFQNNYVDLSAFYMNIKDTITARLHINGDRYYENAGASIHKGIEFSLSSKLTNRLSSKLAYSYSKHNYQNDDSYNNNEMANAPRQKFNAKLFYTPAPKISLLAEMQHISSYFMDDNNTRKYKGYRVGNIKANYKANKKLNVYAKVNNITNKTYAQHATYSYGSEKYTPAAPREFFIGMEYKF